MSEETYTFPAIIDKIQTMKDGSTKINILTREMPPNEMALIFELRNKEGFAAFSPHQIQEDDIAFEDGELPEDKPLHVRLQRTLYVWWEQSYQHEYEEFGDFYKHRMNKLIEQIKEKLEPR